MNVVSHGYLLGHTESTESTERIKGHTDLTDPTDVLYSKDSGIQGLFLF